MKWGACSVAKENIAWEVNAYALCADSTERGGHTMAGRLAREGGDQYEKGKAVGRRRSE